MYLVLFTSFLKRKSWNAINPFDCNFSWDILSLHRCQPKKRQCKEHYNIKTWWKSLNGNWFHFIATDISLRTWFSPNKPASIWSSRKAKAEKNNKACRVKHVQNKTFFNSYSSDVINVLQSVRLKCFQDEVCSRLIGKHLYCILLKQKLTFQFSLILEIFTLTFVWWVM